MNYEHKRIVPSASVRVGQQDNKSGKGIFTASGLYSQASKSLCVFCNKEEHALSKCYSVTNLCPVRPYFAGKGNVSFA